VEFGRRLHWEAMRAGLGRAQAKLIVGDGASWIWNLAQDRWAGATEVLDFYHASQHLWELGRAVVGTDEAMVAHWVEPRRPVESQRRKRQCRFKRPGQSWTPSGMRNLVALTEARHNAHWDELWNC